MEHRDVIHSSATNILVELSSFSFNHSLDWKGGVLSGFDAIDRRDSRENPCPFLFDFFNGELVHAHKERRASSDIPQNDAPAEQIEAYLPVFERSQDERLNGDFVLPDQLPAHLVGLIRIDEDNHAGPENHSVANIPARSPRYEGRDHEHDRRCPDEADSLHKSLTLHFQPGYPFFPFRFAMRSWKCTGHVSDPKVSNLWSDENTLSSPAAGEMPFDERRVQEIIHRWIILHRVPAWPPVAEELQTVSNEIRPFACEKCSVLIIAGGRRASRPPGPVQCGGSHSADTNDLNRVTHSINL